MRLQRVIDNLLPICLTLVMAACADDIQLAEPVVCFKAQGGPTVCVTRATYDGTWRTADEVAVRRGDGTVRKYQPASNGSNTTLVEASGVEPFRWSFDKVGQAFSAWMPYNNGTLPTTWAVSVDQSAVSDDVFYNYDLLYAPELSVEYRELVGLVFYHQMARITINIADSPEEVTSVLFGNGNVKNSGNISVGSNPVWSSLSGSNTITLHRVGTTNTYVALLPPQTVGNAETNLISIVTSTGNYTYKAQAVLIAGQHNQYNVTVNPRLSVTATISLWNSNSINYGGGVSDTD